MSTKNISLERQIAGQLEEIELLRGELAAARCTIDGIIKLVTEGIPFTLENTGPGFTDEIFNERMASFANDSV
jgi:hypothetical protein